jgi:hypothetical protein
VAARQQESEEHLKRVQAEIIQETEMLRGEVAQGRTRVQEEVER